MHNYKQIPAGDSFDNHWCSSLLPVTCSSKKCLHISSYAMASQWSRWTDINTWDESFTHQDAFPPCCSSEGQGSNILGCGAATTFPAAVWQQHCQCQTLPVAKHYGTFSMSPLSPVGMHSPTEATKTARADLHVPYMTATLSKFVGSRQQTFDLYNIR